MKNGKGLHGSYTSTQSAIVVPKPSSKDLFYIFTVDSQAQPNGYGLNYSIVNSRAQGFEGEVIEKNIFLTKPVPEKLTAVRHSNNIDVWVIAHEWNSDKFICYLVTKDGISQPVISSAGLVYGEPAEKQYNLNSLGYMKASPGGDRIAMAHSEEALVQVFNFDNSTGIVSTGFHFNTGTWPYGIEFSPNSRFLYVSEETSIYQMDLNAGSTSQVIHSYSLVSESLKYANQNGGGAQQYEYGALQLAPDGNLYVAVRGLPNYEPYFYLSAIRHPNNIWSKCDYRDSAIYLMGKKCTLGLPNFIQSYFKSTGFNWFSTCLGDETSFLLDGSLTYESFSWDFGDPGSGSSNQSFDVNPKHRFSKSGSFWVKFKYTYNSHTDSLVKRVSITDYTKFSLGADRTKCKSDTIILGPVSPDCLYKWQDQSKDSILKVSTAGTYQLSLTNPYGCVSKSSVKVSENPNPRPELGNNKTACEGTPVILEAYLSNCTFLWQDNTTTTSFFQPTSSGKYSVTATNTFGCKGTDSISVDFLPVPKFSFGPDTFLCTGSRTRLVVPNSTGSTMLWNNGNKLDHLDVLKAGKYWCNIKSANGCTYGDTITFTALSSPVVPFGRDTAVCENSKLELDASQPNSNYKWSDGSSNEKLQIEQNSKIWVTISNICGTATDTTNVRFKYCGNIKVPNIITQNNDGLNDKLKIIGIEGESWQIYIYNRWGGLIYDSSQYDNNWPNEKIPDGVYYYLLRNESKHAEEHGFFYINH